MYRNILVPLDGSNFSLGALPFAISVAERAGSDIQLVTSVPTLPPVVPSPEREGMVRGWFEEERARATDFLDRTRRLVQDTGTSVPIHTKVVEGDPAESLEERIRRTEADLVVMTTHGRGPFERAWLGSVADGLIRRSPTPILLWRPPQQDEGVAAPGELKVDMTQRPAFRSIVTPLDGSAPSLAMVPEAVGMARLFGASLSFVTVVADGVHFASPYIPDAAQEEREREAEVRDARGSLERVAEAARQEGVDARGEVIEGDDPGSGILDYCSRIGADLVAMSTRGRGGVRRLVLGSVADKVIRGAGVPVFVHRHGPREGGAAE